MNGFFNQSEVGPMPCREEMVAMWTVSIRNPISTFNTVPCLEGHAVYTYKIDFS